MTDIFGIYFPGPHIYLLVTFPETFSQSETFSCDLLHEHVSFQWLDPLCPAVSEINHPYSPVCPPNILQVTYTYMSIDPAQICANTQRLTVRERNTGDRTVTVKSVDSFM